MQSHREKLQGWRLHSLSGQHAPPPDRPSWAKSCFFYLLFEFVCCFSFFCLASTVKSPAPSPWLPHMRWGLLLGTLEAISASGWTRPDSPVSFHRTSAAAPHILVMLCWTCCRFLMSFSLSSKSPRPFAAEQLHSQWVPILCCWKSYSFPFVLVEIHRVPVSPVLLDGIPCPQAYQLPPSNSTLSANLTGVCSSNSSDTWSLIKLFKRPSPRTRPYTTF